MKTSKISSVMALTLAFTLLWVLSFAQAAEPDDADSLKGLKEGKVIFEAGIGDPENLFLYLSVIKDTHDSMLKQGVKPVMIVQIHGGAVPLVSKKREGMPPERQKKLDDIAKMITELRGIGVDFEVCALAARLLKVDYNDILSGIKLVGNGWVSLVGYQNKGYAIVPFH
ncbi:MAG: DsrE family protein [Nitrospirae bacterium]|nr:DsrE family protein [Nitrospirota bacterium]